MKKFRVTVYGGDPANVQEDIKGIAADLTFEIYDPEKMLEAVAVLPEVILCYPAKAGELSSIEIAQTLRMNYPETAIYFIASDKKDFDKKKLVKNGFTQAFLLPWEKTDFLKSLKEEAVYSDLPELRDYKPVKVVDLLPGTVLDFGLRIYLPMNNKLLTFAHEGDPIDEKKLLKLQENSLNTLFIHKDDVKKFRDYTGKVLKELSKNGLSETDKGERLHSCVRELMSDMFIQDSKENTFGKSQALLNEVKEVIKTMMLDGNTEWAKKVDSLINQEQGFYLHLTNVSTYCGLFSMLLGFEKPENMALAGILHDLGKINLPPEYAEMDESEYGPHALEAFKKHPAASIDISKMKKLILPEEVMKAIAQHHEKINGTGYPSGLSGVKISKEARLLAIADSFDYLTTLKSGVKGLSPVEAFQVLIDNNSKDPGRVELDVEMLKTLKKTLYS